MEIRFDNPEYLILMLSIPLLAITHYYFLRFTKRKAMKFANFEALKRVSGKRLLTKNLLMLAVRSLVVFLLILGISGPVVWYEGATDSMNVVLAIDTSASMTATDVPPDRFMATKQLAISFIDGLDGPTQVGVVSFSGAAFIDGLLQEDKGHQKRLIEDLDISLSGGTDLGGAIITSVNLLVPAGKPGSVLLFSDGSNSIGTFVDDDVQAGIDYAKRFKIKVYTVGVGSEEGIARYLDEGTNLPAGYNREILKSIAEQTGGDFVEFLADQDKTEFLDQVSGLAEHSYVSLELGFGLTAVSLLLLFVEWGLINTKFRAIP